MIAMRSAFIATGLDPAEQGQRPNSGSSAKAVIDRGKPGDRIAADAALWGRSVNLRFRPLRCHLSTCDSAQQGTVSASANVRWRGD